MEANSNISNKVIEKDDNANDDNVKKKEKAVVADDNGDEDNNSNDENSDDEDNNVDEKDDVEDNVGDESCDELVKPKIKNKSNEDISLNEIIDKMENVSAKENTENNIEDNKEANIIDNYESTNENGNKSDKQENDTKNKMNVNNLEINDKKTFEKENLKKNKDIFLENINNLEEINLKIENSDTITLKNPNEVYLDIYRAAREKAKKARDEAIKAYLEAKRIKELYLLDIADSSDEESGSDVYESQNI